MVLGTTEMIHEDESEVQLNTRSQVTRYAHRVRALSIDGTRINRGQSLPCATTGCFGCAKNTHNHITHYTCFTVLSYITQKERKDKKIKIHNTGHKPQQRKINLLSTSAAAWMSLTFRSRLKLKILWSMISELWPLFTPLDQCKHVLILSEWIKQTVPLPK